LLPPPARTQILFNSFIHATTRDWNDLPVDTREASTIEAFGYRLGKKEKVPSHYYTGPRRGQIYHARLRLECSSLNAHLFVKNIVDSPECSCGANIESTTHYLLECQNFAEERDTLFEEINDFVALPTDILLYGSETLTLQQNEWIFESTQRYILKTERFG
jgi:hypothetical protein